MQYISTTLYQKVIDHAISEGMTREDFVDLPTPITALGALDAVPADHFFALHERVDARLEPGFSVRVGQEMKIEDYGVLGMSWRTCSWAGEIFDRSERYFKLLSNTYVFKVKRAPDVSRVYLYRDAYRKGVALSNEATFSAIVVVLKAITETEIAPVEVAFQHNPPKVLDAYIDAFQCPVLFGQMYNVMTYRAQDLELRTAKADASINQFLVDRVEEETNGIEFKSNKIAFEVEQLIRDALASGIPGISQIGLLMGMSNRTLTRRLGESGLTFRDLVKKAQFEISQDLLRNTSSSIAEIAFATGFSEQSAFNRAFRRWTDQSPLEYRNAGI